MGQPPPAPPGRFCCCFSPLLLARGAFLLQNQGLSPRFIVASPFQTLLLLGASSSGGRWSCGHAVQMLNEASAPPQGPPPSHCLCSPPNIPAGACSPQLGSGSLVSMNIHFSSAPALPASASHLPTCKPKSLSPSPPPREDSMWFQDDSAAARHRPCPLPLLEQEAGGGLGFGAHKGIFWTPAAHAQLVPAEPCLTSTRSIRGLLASCGKAIVPLSPCLPGTSCSRGGI